MAKKKGKGRKKGFYSVRQRKYVMGYVLKKGRKKVKGVAGQTRFISASQAAGKSLKQLNQMMSGHTVYK